MKISIDQLVVSAERVSRNIDQELAPLICRHCQISENALKGYQIIRRSVDARKKPSVKLLYRLVAEVVAGTVPVNAKPWQEEKLLWTPDALKSLRGKSVVIVGAGPAGLFGALTVALAGGKPVVCDRGQSVEQRGRDIQHFRTTRQLNEESNYLFGEGGAGTWSDGKLFTRVNDPRVNFVLQEFIRCGASETIGYFSHPHIGSDKLPGVIQKLRERIISLGGEFHWGARVKKLLIRSGRCEGVVLENGEILEADAVLVACGHSARDFILNMTRQGVGFELKNFQLGMRLEHPQGLINYLQYGEEESYPALGAAEYNVVSRPAENTGWSGVTSFCMCPGGEVIPATSENNHLCTNGMSNAARNSRWANAAIITTIPAENFANVERAYRFLEQIEGRCFEAGGEDYSCPAQTAVDFVMGRQSRRLISSSFCFGLRSARLDQLLPPQVAGSIRYAMRYFDRQNPGFVEYGQFLGIEARVSSPVRFLRQETSRESTIPHLWIAGEGAGMAGGITSAAVDGIKMAEAIGQSLL